MNKKSKKITGKEAEIKEIEEELTQLVENDKNSWAKFYTLMKRVEDEQLYKVLGLNSFTQWLKSFAIQHKIHESVLWNKKKAGKVYERYIEVKKEQGIEVPKIEDANVGVDSLVLLDKISKKNADLGAELTEKAINREVTRADLRNAYKTIRGDLKKDIVVKNPIKVIEDDNKLHEDGNGDIINIEAKEDHEDNVTATNIVMALNNHNWLGEKEVVKGFKGRFIERKYKAFTEFPVYTGTTKKSRRIDVLVAENISIEEHYNLQLHGIEIKVAKGDLLNDTKYTEYAEFVNKLWIAVPQNLLAECKKNTPKNIGILVFKDGEIKVNRNAKTLKSQRLKETLTTLALKLL